MKIGFLAIKNAKPIGTVIKPPNPTIASIFSFLIILIVVKTLIGIRVSDFILAKIFLPLKPCIDDTKYLNLVAFKALTSIGSPLPMKITSCPSLLISCPTAIAGNICPPVFAAETKIFI